MTGDSSSLSLQVRLDALYARRARGIKLGLENVSALLGELGDPHRELGPVHVAGTNGKGSVCAMLDAVLRAAGFRPGLYTSPHLVRFNERIRIDSRPIPDEDLLPLLEEIDRADAKVAGRPCMRRSTFFEFTTAAALTWFQRNQARLAVLETGLGGRLDATNVVHPLLVILTSMARDHTDYLGSTLTEIAAEKAGIIKEGRPVVCGLMRGEARDVVMHVAHERGAPVVDVRDAVSVRLLDESLDGQRVKIETASASYPPLTLGLLGRHQLENAASVVAAVEYLDDAGLLRIGGEALRKGLEGVAWPARLQVLEKDPPVLLDAAHNPAGAAAVAEALERVLPGRPLGLVVGMASDKDAAGFVRRIAARVNRCWTVPIDNPRGLSPVEMQRHAEAVGLETRTGSLADALADARDWAATNEGAVLISGSIYLAGDTLRTLDRGRSSR